MKCLPCSLVALHTSPFPPVAVFFLQHHVLVSHCLSLSLGHDQNPLRFHCKPWQALGPHLSQVPRAFSALACVPQDKWCSRCCSSSGPPLLSFGQKGTGATLLLCHIPSSRGVQDRVSQCSSLSEQPLLLHLCLDLLGYTSRIAWTQLHAPPQGVSPPLYSTVTRKERKVGKGQWKER